MRSSANGADENAVVSTFVSIACDNVKASLRHGRFGNQIIKYRTMFNANPTLGPVGNLRTALSVINGFEQNSKLLLGPVGNQRTLLIVDRL